MFCHNDYRLFGNAFDTSFSNKLFLKTCSLFFFEKKDRKNALSVAKTAVRRYMRLLYLNIPRDTKARVPEINTMQ